jgi:predicted Ser/Thr protein kinase
MPTSDREKPSLSRATLVDHTDRVLRPSSWVKPAILLAQADGDGLVVKDFLPTAWLIRHTYGRWLVRRESRIYARLDGIAGVPAFRGRIDRFAFAIDFVEGSTLKALPRRQIPAVAFDRLGRLLDRVHAAGVVHFDSHQKKNVILSPDGQPYLVDFATALFLGTNGFSQRVLVPLLGRADRWGLLKLKSRYCSDALTPRERRRLRLSEWLGWLWPPSCLRRLIKGPRARRHQRRRAARKQAQRESAEGEEE